MAVDALPTVVSPPLEKLYEQICAAVKTTDETSFRLLGLVPLVSGTGITAFLTADKQLAWSAATFFLSVFGASVTFALFRWELRNISHCKWLIARGAELEAALGLESGQFLGRPGRNSSAGSRSARNARSGSST
jgi:hypothetical protein